MSKVYPKLEDEGRWVWVERERDRETEEREMGQIGRISNSELKRSDWIAFDIILDWPNKTKGIESRD